LQCADHGQFRLAPVANAEDLSGTRTGGIRVRVSELLLAELDAEQDRIMQGPNPRLPIAVSGCSRKSMGTSASIMADPMLSVEKLAGKYGVSKSYLYSIFEKMLAVIRPNTSVSCGFSTPAGC
jgi:AraC-like DNA-binding protein